MKEAKTNGKAKQLITSLALLTSLSCVNQTIEDSSLPDIQYFLEYNATGNNENRLLLYTNQSDLRLEITSPDEGLSASVPLRNRVAVPNVVELQAQAEKNYQLDVRIYLKDGTLYQEESLTWSYSLANPPDPVAGFAVEATNTDQALLYISSSKGADTGEIWIEGDLAADFAPEGRWRPIPQSGVLPINISSSDGLKVFKVKTRNIYGNVSTEKTIPLLKKTTIPENCQISVADQSSHSGFVKVRLAAEDTHPVYFRVYGDTENSRSFQKFEGSTEATIELSQEAGTKRVYFQIRDIAGNFCLEDEMEFHYDPDYNPAKVQIISHQYWTDEEEVQVYLEYPHFADKNVEVLFFGDVIGENVGTWLPLTESYTVRLNPNNGTRWVRVRFRENGVLMAANYDGIYLRPFIIVQGEQAPYQVKISNINHVESLNIRGCMEVYQDLSYQNSYSCTPVESSIAVDYFFKDGSSLTRQSPLPL
ncbi:MAG: hypothetical protein ACOH5I_13795 [Oligoflexus sp.]